MALVWFISLNDDEDISPGSCLEFVPFDAAVVPSVSLVAPDCIERIVGQPCVLVAGTVQPHERRWQSVEEPGL
jgi:hypothetical protein